MGAHNKDARMGWYIIVGTIPIMIVGLLFQSKIETVLRNLWITVAVLIIFGILLWWFDDRSKQIRSMDDLTWRDSLFIGLGQMMALIPGVSRSGGTITVGRALGYTREAAARMSFFMAIPAVFGSGLLEAVKSAKDASSMPYFPGWGATIVAAVVSFIVGYVVIIAFLRIVSTFSYKGFAIYRIVVAVLVGALMIAGVLAPLAGAATA
jgi:undecaprenyl-diphosphatase